MTTFSECERQIAKEEDFPLEDLRKIDNQIEKAKETLVNRRAKAAERAAKAAASPEAAALEKEIRRLENLNLKVAKKVEDAKSIISPTDERNYYRLHQELARAPDSGSKNKLQSGIDALEKQWEPQNPETQLKNKTLQWSKDAAGTIYDNFKGYLFSNLLGLGSVQKKGLTDITQLVLTPVAYAATGHLEAAKAFISDVANTVYDKTKSSPLEALRASRAFTAFMQAMATGETTHYKGEDFLKADFAAGEKLNPLRITGIIPRTLSSLSEAFYVTNKGAQAKAIATDLLERGAKNQLTQREQELGLGDKGVQEALAKHLYDAPRLYNQALAAAEETSKILERTTGTGLTDPELHRAAWDRMHELLPEAVKEQIDNFGQKQTFINHPTGFLGKVYDIFNKFRSLTVGGERSPQFLQYEFPFIRVGFNIVNASLDFTPVGIYRATSVATEFVGERGGKPFTRDKAYLERSQELFRGVAGTAIMATLLGLAVKNKDDPNASLRVHGDWTDLSFQEREQKRAEGQIPSSIQVGSNYYSYKDHLLEAPLSIVGNFVDYLNKPNRGPLTPEKAMLLAGTLALGPVTNLSVFKTLTDLQDAINTKNVDTGAYESKIKDIMFTNPARGLVPFHGTLNFFDTTPIDRYQGVWASVIAGVPYVENLGGTRPAINYMGEPISKGLADRFGAFWTIGYGSSNSQGVSPEWQFLAKNGYTLPKDQAITIHLMSPEEEAKVPSIGEKRAANYGAQYANILTEDERYQLIQRAGPQIKQLVGSYAQSYGNSGFNPAVQKQLNEQVSKIFNYTKRSMFLR